MLILTRLPDQKIMIGDDVVIVVTAIQGNRVKLGIDCPAHVPVLRAEAKVRERKLAESNGETAGREEPSE